MSADGLRVRQAEAADVAAVILLERRTAEAPHWGEAEYAGIVEAAGESELAGGGIRRCLMVGELGDRVVGFAVGKVVNLGVGLGVGLGGDAMGELESLAVEGSARRMGVGRALYRAVAEWCGGQGAVAIELEVRAGSGGAIALYEGVGFVGVGRRLGYYREPADDALLMRLELVG